MHHETPAADPSPLRIGALSTAIAANLVALLGLTLMQQTLPDMPRRPTPQPPIQVELTPRPIVPATPAPPMPTAPIRPRPHTTPMPMPTPVALPAVEPVWAMDRAAEPPASSMTPAMPAAPAPDGSGGGRAGLAYLQAPPPPYPPVARRRMWQGEVVLRVHVGTDGRPVDVTVERSSGHALLDRTAREHVLSTWRFVPALRDGLPIEAQGRVPIRFALQ